MTLDYEGLRDLIETKVLGFGWEYRTGTLKDLTHFTQSISATDVLFLNETSDHNADIIIHPSGNMQNTFAFRMYILDKHKSDINESDLDLYFSKHVVNANKFIRSFLVGAGKNYSVLTANARRLKMVTPNLFAGVLLTFSVRIRGKCT